MTRKLSDVRRRAYNAITNNTRQKTPFLLKVATFQWFV